MKEVELPLSAIRWPECCCSCGSKNFAWKQHTEKVVLWTVLSVTSYREVTLTIPVCTNCALRSWWWYGAAAATWAMSYLALSIADSHHLDIGSAFAIPLLAGVAMAIKGTRTSPLRILKFDPDKGRAILKIHHDAVALRVAKDSGGRESFEEKTRMRRLLIIGVASLLGVLVLATILRHMGN